MRYNLKIRVVEPNVQGLNLRMMEFRRMAKVKVLKLDPNLVIPIGQNLVIIRVEVDVALIAAEEVEEVEVISFMGEEGTDLK